MRKTNWRKHHKWSGIVSSLLVLIFCVSGIVLNHRNWVSNIEISRQWLPPGYSFQNWNGGLLRGTIPYKDKVLIFGVNGIWITDSTAFHIDDFNAGLPKSADHRQVKNIVACGNRYFAVTPEALYTLDGEQWKNVDIGIRQSERLSDICSKGDTLIVVGRSNLYLTTSNNSEFQKIELKSARNSDGKTSLFKTIWNLHSGELFGFSGKLLFDFIAIIMAFLSVSGIVLWLIPKSIRKRFQLQKPTENHIKVLKASRIWHNRAGKATIPLSMLIIVTGWCLRPPLMIPLAMFKTSPLPGTMLDNDNPWHDKLRMLRYDNNSDEWLISSSEGFFSLHDIRAIPKRIDSAPPVSVMGLNVWTRDSLGNWICGSFSGIYRWHRPTGLVWDYFSGDQTDVQETGSPFGKFAVAGYAKEWNAVIEYNDGTDSIPQPEKMKHLPMSLWNVALEAHSGRLLIGDIATYLYIFFTGGIIAWCLWSGWKIRQNKHKRN